MIRYRFSSLEEFAVVRNQIKAEITKVCPHSDTLLYVALNEAVNNAIFHGYEQQQEQVTPVEIILDHQQNEFRMIVRHEGVGFNCNNIEQLSAEDLTDHGRGIDIIKMCTDDFYYNKCGTELVMRKFIA
jgi:serine/threonine-protein kinase RsbW